MSAKKDMKNALLGVIGRDATATRRAGDPVVVSLGVSQLVARPSQPRRYFDASALESLAGSIRQHGILQPLVVRPRDDTYEVVCGERRLRAARVAGLSSVPCVVRDCTDHEADRLSILENLQRENLDRFEEVSYKLRMVATEWRVSEAEAKVMLRRLRKQPLEDPTKVQQLESLFATLGKERWNSFVVNGLPVLDLPPLLVEAVQRGDLQYTKAVLISRAPAEHHAHLLQQVFDEKLGTDDLRARVAQLRPRLEAGDAAQHITAVKRRLAPRAIAALPRERRERVHALIAELAGLLEDPRDA